jgi:hypothetical protein
VSLTSLIARRDVAERIDALVPRYVRTHRIPLLVKRVWPDASLIGTAYDYALRIHLRARYPHAETESWVAEEAVSMLGLNPFLIFSGSVKRTLQRARHVIEAAKEFAGRHMARARPFAEVAAHAVRLAKLDPICRNLSFDETFARADGGAVDEIAALLRVTPFDRLGDATFLRLNPTFGRYGKRVGGADADLLAGDRIIDVKVKSSSCVERVHVRQLVGYVMLANSVNKLDGSMPRIREICIYFARHAFLWSLPTGSLFAHEAYDERERWLVRGAPYRKRPKLENLERLRLLYRRPLPPTPMSPQRTRW